MFLLLVAFLFGSAYALPTALHRIPLQNGSFTYLSDLEVQHFKDLAPLEYNPDTGIKFHLYTQENPIDSQTIRLNSKADLEASSFNPKNPTK